MRYVTEYRTHFLHLLFALSKLKPHFLTAFPQFFKEPRSLTPPFSEKATTAQATINPLHILGQARTTRKERSEIFFTNFIKAFYPL
jgi:hypothetical protein